MGNLAIHPSIHLEVHKAAVHMDISLIGQII